MNRGAREPVPGVTALAGDRMAPDGLRALDGKSFDVVVDTWPGEPIAVERAVDALRDRVGYYIYVSTISVYASGDDYDKPHLNEESPTLDVETSDFKYGVDKRRAELAVEASGIPSLIVRPGIILGPGEGAKGRMAWWFGRLGTGGPTLAPGPRDSTMQFIDARDIAGFLMDSIAASAPNRPVGIFNILSRAGHLTTEEFFETCNGLAGGKAELKWAEPEKILAAGIEPWSELPLWMPPGRKHDFAYNINVDKVFGAGLRVRPARETIIDAWEWFKNLDKSTFGHTTGNMGNLGLDYEKEKAFLEKLEQS